MLRIAIIVASTRQGRFGDTVARWFTDQAQQRADLDLDVIDLRDVPLRPVQQPPFDCDDPAVHALAARIDAADGFVVITPEYNHGYPAALKLAIDSVYHPWKAKPVAFVSYGGIAGGLRAVEQLRLVFAELHAVTIRDTVSFHMAHNQFDEHGVPHDPDDVNKAAKTLLDRLTWWTRVLHEARATQPYGC
ncbi:NAD(P)H-dependent oxidoreductase [Nocardia sp. NPDC051990]|uniref:NADPH-dependent FMN reductase n=1 Tax=Nocardia sp. NPDC051990 TaxID=3155285 RepID=UPI0034360A19